MAGREVSVTKASHWTPRLAWLSVGPTGRPAEKQGQQGRNAVTSGLAHHAEILAFYRRQSH